MNGHTEMGDIMKRSVEGPRALKQLYEEFEYLLLVETDVTVDEFVQREPTLEEYDAYIEKLYSDMQKIQDRSLNEVCDPPPRSASHNGMWGMTARSPIGGQWLHRGPR